MTAISSRNLRRHTTALTLAVVLFGLALVRAEADQPDTTLVSGGTTDASGAPLEIATALFASGLSKPVVGNVSAAGKELLNDILHSPETLNKANELLRQGSHGWAFLKDINFKFKAFQATQADAKASLGFEYSFDRSLAQGDVSCNACARGLDLSVHADGNVAFDKDLNPNDFLDTRVSFSFFQSTGGLAEPTDEQRREFVDVSMAAAQLKRADDPKKFDALVARMLEIGRSRLTTQYYLEASGNAHLESNQTFTQKQYVFDARLMGEIKAWGSLGATDFNSLDNWSKFNLLDYPFALLRVLTGFDSCTDASGTSRPCFLPRGVSLPTISVAIGTVKPQGDDPRTALAGPGSYTRLSAEASFKTPVATMGGKQVSVAMNYRLYDELHPPAAVTAAGLNRFNYFVVTLGTQKGPFVSYSTGQLPFDLKSDKVYSLGFQTYLQ